MTRQLITAFEHMHSIGRVHNDLKPSNVLMNEKGSAILIDYGLCQKFEKTDKKSCFYGNIMFAGIRKLGYKMTSRKDDMLSLAYMLIYIVCNKTLPFADEFYSGDLSDCDSAEEDIHQMLKFKTLYPISLMAERTGIQEVINFCQIVDDMDQLEQPHYALLKKVLKSDKYTKSLVQKKLNKIPIFPAKKVMMK